MTETKAKKHLAKILERFTTGSVLHLLADLSREMAQDAEREGDLVRYEQAKSVERTLFVVGVGVDSVMVE